MNPYPLMFLEPRSAAIDYPLEPPQAVLRHSTHLVVLEKCRPKRPPHRVLTEDL